MKNEREGKTEQGSVYSYFLLKTVQRIYDRSIIDVFCKGNYKLFIRGYSPLCFYLRTKESYDWRITRRFWEFRHQISKAKYPKISQTVGRKYQEASGEHRGTVQHSAFNLE